MTVIRQPDYASQVDQLRSDLEVYFREQNIDVSLDDYLSQILDSLPVGGLDHPSLEQYFQLAYKQLVEIEDPELYYSLQAQVGGPPSFDALYENADDDLNELVVGYLQNEPELLALFAELGGGDIQGSDVLNVIAQVIDENDVAENQKKVFNDARSLGDRYGLGDGFDWAVDQDEAFTASMQAIMGRLSELDQSYAEFMKAFDAGDISETELNQKLQGLGSSRETLMFLLTSQQDLHLNLMDMIGDIFKNQIEAIRNTVNRFAF